MESGNGGTSYTPIALILFTVILLYLAASTLSTGQTRNLEVVVPVLNVEKGTYTFTSTLPLRPLENMSRAEPSTATRARLQPVTPGPLQRLLELIAGLFSRLLKLISEVLSRLLVKPIEAPQVVEEAKPTVIYASPEHVLFLIGIASVLAAVLYRVSRRRRHITPRKLRVLIPAGAEEKSRVEELEEQPVDLARLRRVRDPATAILEAFRIMYLMALRKLKARDSYTHREIASLYEGVSLGREAETIASAFEALKFAGRIPKVNVDEVLAAALRIVERVSED